METQSIEAALKSAVDSIRRTPAIRRRKNVSYVTVVKVGYEEIQKLRSDGYSYDIICKILSENGALGVDASPKNLCTAFLREKNRRLSRTQTASQNPRASSSLTGKANQNNGGEAKKTEQEKGQTRAMAGTVVDTGTGKIIKRMDGSFEY